MSTSNRRKPGTGNQGKTNGFHHQSISDTPPEEPRPHFRGTWAPADLHYLLYDKKINTTEFVLLQIIDSLVDPKGDGCWASNEYLARRVGLKDPKDVQKMVKKFKGLGLVKQVGTKRIGGRDYRVLETAWSRIQIPPEGEEGGDYSPPYPGNNPPQRISSSLRSEEIRKGDEGNPARGSAPPPPRPVCPRPLPPKPSTNGHAVPANGFDLADKSNKRTNPVGCKPRTTPEDLEIARKLLDAAKGLKGFVPSRITCWADAVATLRRKLGGDLERMKRVFDWYCENHPDLDPKVPRIRTAGHISEKVFAWHESEMGESVGEALHWSGYTEAEWAKMNRGAW